MINKIKHFFEGNKRKTTKYKGFSDFFMNAPGKIKKEVITEAAHRANEDQLKVFNKVRAKGCYE